MNLLLPATDPDADFDTLTIVLVTPPQHGDVTFDGLMATYVPDPNYVGPDTFTYRVFDGRDNSEDIGTVELEIDPVEDTPMIEVEPESEVSTGFRLIHRVDVFDPDADETLYVSIDWGDGESTVDGHFMLDGSPIPALDAMNPDGTIRDDVETTGPILGVNTAGRGILGGDHVYTRPGTYNVESCVYDKAEVDEETQDKSLTGASKQTCATTAVTVTDTAELGVETVAPEDPVAPGTDVNFMLTLTNLEFDLEADDPRFGELPATGTPVTGLEIDGELTPHLTLIDVSSTEGVCSVVDASSFGCSFMDLPYGASASIELRTAVAPTAPGRSDLGFAVDANGVGLREAIVAGGRVEVASSGIAPVLATVSPGTGEPSGFEEVTLVGVNFEQGMRVFFGGKPGTQVRVTDSTTLTVLTPAQSEGTVDITVMNRARDEATLADAWTYEAAGSGGGGGGGGSGGGGSVAGAVLVVAGVPAAAVRPASRSVC